MKKLYLKKLNLPVFEEKIAKIFCFKFKDAITSLCKLKI